MHVLIPAGGRGTRLRPLTNDLPKPLLPLGDQPILSRIVNGIPPAFPVTVIVTPDFEGQFRRWREAMHADRDIRIFVEGEAYSGPRGPVAAIAECVEKQSLQEDVLILMGDSLHPFQFDDFFASRSDGEVLLAAHPLSNIRDATRFGVVEIGPDGHLVSFEEKPAHPRSHWIFTGCCFLPARLLASLGRIAAEVPPQMGHLVGAYLERGERIAVHRFTGEWNDIGTFGSYLEAHRSQMSAGRLQQLVAQGNRLGGVVYVHPSARVSNSILCNCVVFEHTQIRNARLTDCVVRPFVSITDRVLDCKLISREAELAVIQGDPR